MCELLANSTIVQSIRSDIDKKQLVESPIMKDRGLIKSHKNAIMTVLGSVLLVSGVVLLVFWPDIFETIKFKVNIN